MSLELNLIIIYIYNVRLIIGNIISDQIYRGFFVFNYIFDHYNQKPYSKFK